MPEQYYRHMQHNSNTSHVLIYQKRENIHIHWKMIQIHLMFLFIYQGGTYGTSTDGFKYISCSYLSDWCGQKVAILPNSNTSHVLIYHIWLTTGDGEMFIFKYISCSYLS